MPNHDVELLYKSQLYDSAATVQLVSRTQEEPPAIALISLVRAGRKCDEKAYANIAKLARELIT